MSASGHFFHARQSSEILPDKLVLKPSRHKRSALSERSASQINTENSDHPTIRLVDPDSSSPNVYDKTPFPRMPSQVLKPTKTTKHGYTVQNDAGVSSLDERLRPRSASPTRTSRLFPHPLSLNKSNRISASTTTSNADTLLNDSLYSPMSNRFSTEGTLRNTPTPQEMDERTRERERTEALDALEEESQGPSTIRPVTASSGSGSTERARVSRDSYRSLPIHPALRQRPPTPPRHGRLSSIESVATPVSAGPSGRSPVEEPSSEYSSRQSSSSPNVPRSSSYNVITYATSEDGASVQYPQVRPATAQSQSAESAWSTSGSDSLPPLSVARKRLHAHSASAGAQLGSIRPLSTIASESEPSSRSHTRSRFSQGSADILSSNARPSPLRHMRSRTVGSSTYSSFSSGSNYETIPSDGSQADSTQFSMMRAQSAVPTPLFSSTPSMPAYEVQGETPTKDTEGEQDDTIAELYAPVLRMKRSGHLNRRRSISDPPPGSSRSNQTGTVTETDRTSQGSSIFPIWAKHFYRGRTQLASANASKVSLARPDSQGLSTRSPVRMMPWAHHRRFESGWESYNTADQSMFSDRPGTTQSNLSGFSDSQRQSSHFLPSIFRPYTRKRAYTDITAASHSQPHSDAFDDESSGSEAGGDHGSTTRQPERDSLEITAAPARQGDGHVAYHPSPLASSPTRNKRSQRHRQRQRQSDLHHDDTFGSSRRYPSTTLSATQLYDTPPHLAPSRRFSNRISAWRAPSFDEALNTLFISRQNRQILFFCLGFLCPILWMVAAFLPIPPRPLDPRTTSFAETEGVSEDALKAEGGHYDLGMQMEMFDWEQEKRYLKARWWRNLNRVMSFVGVGVIVAIIVLAVVASR